MRWLAVGVWLIPLAAAAIAGVYAWRTLGPDRVAALRGGASVRWLTRQKFVVALFGWVPIGAVVALFAPWYVNLVMAAGAVVAAGGVLWAGLRETRRPGDPTDEAPRHR